MKALSIRFLAFVLFSAYPETGVPLRASDSFADASAAAQVSKRVAPLRKLEMRRMIMRKQVEARGPARGPVNAPVTIIEFADFQCPFSAKLVDTLDQVIHKYGDKIRLVFRQYPLPMHPNAAKAAEAALCAWEQGKFWEMHDAMFENQQELYVDHLKAKAAELGLNAESFNHNLDTGKYATDVQRDFQAGQEAGVNGTPALFINGRFVSGAVPFEEITQIVDDELAHQ
jgi:protein-disulfide isomerase